jgi:hypothetical protein
MPTMALALSLLVGSALLAPPAAAQLAGVAAAGVAGGLSANAAQAQATTERLPGTEPPDWVDPSTGTTTVLGRGCGSVTQVTLTTTPGTAYLHVLTPCTVGEFSFGGGARLLTTGELRELGPRPGFSAGFDFTVFFSLHHGATLDVALETPGRAQAAKAFPERTFDGAPRIEAAGFFLGYVARLPVAPWLALSYSPQLGVIPFQLSDKQGAQATSAVFCPVNGCAPSSRSFASWTETPLLG